MNRPPRHTILLVALSLTVALTAAAGLPAQPTPPAAETPPFFPVAQITQSNAGATDHFGEAIAISGDTLVIRGNDFGGPSLYFHERNAGGSNRWGEVLRMSAPPGVPRNGFARDFDLDTDTLVILMELEDSWYGAAILEQAEVWPQWEVQSILEKPDRGAFFDVGYLVGDVEVGKVLLGSQADEERGFNAGAAYFYEQRPDRSWNLAEKLIGSAVDSGDAFGSAVAIDRETLVVAAHLDDVLDTENSGSVYVYEREEEGLWSEVTQIIPSIREESDQFGWSLALEGDLLAVGTPFAAPTEVSNSGAVFLYERDAGGSDNWGEIAVLVHENPEVGDAGGWSVAVEDGRVLFGAYGRNDGEITGTGAAYVFEQDPDGTWRQTVELVSENRNKTDNFGEEVAMSHGTLVIGRPNADEGGWNAGMAHLFEESKAPAIEVVGACPGTVSMTITGATTSGPVALVHATAPGTTVVPSGRCGATRIDLDDGQILSRLLVDEDGTTTVQRTVAEENCGRFFQAIDMVTCGAGAVVQGP